MSSRTFVLRFFLGEGEAPLMGDDVGKQFSSLTDRARGSGELKRSSSSICRDGERAKRVEVVIVARQLLASTWECFDCWMIAHQLRNVTWRWKWQTRTQYQQRLPRTKRLRSSECR